MTTIPVDVTGFEELLAFAVEQHNSYFLQRDPTFKPVTLEEYVQALMKRQLEGLQVAKGKITTDQEARAQEARDARQRHGTLAKLGR